MKKKSIEVSKEKLNQILQNNGIFLTLNECSLNKQLTNNISVVFSDGTSCILDENFNLFSNLPNHKGVI